MSSSNFEEEDRKYQIRIIWLLMHSKIKQCLTFLTVSDYSHSTVAGGLVVISYTTRLTRGTSLTMRALTLASRS